VRERLLYNTHRDLNMLVGRTQSWVDEIRAKGITHLRNMAVLAPARAMTQEAEAALEGWNQNAFARQQERAEETYAAAKHSGGGRWAKFATGGLLGTSLAFGAWAARSRTPEDMLQRTSAASAAAAATSSFAMVEEQNRKLRQHVRRTERGR
jgi:hypothetical protein